MYCCSALITAKKKWNCNHDQDWHVPIIIKAGDITSSQKKVLFNHEIYLLYLSSSYLEALLCLPSAPECFRPSLPADPFCFCDRKAPNLRLGPAEILQWHPCVDLINMAAPAWCWGLTVLTVSTPEFELKAWFCHAVYLYRMVEVL